MRIEIGAHSQSVFSSRADLKNSVLRFLRRDCDRPRAGVGSRGHFLDIGEVAGPNGQSIFKSHGAANFLGHRLELRATNVIAVGDDLCANEYQ